MYIFTLFCVSVFVVSLCLGLDAQRTGLHVIAHAHCDCLLIIKVVLLLLLLLLMKLLQILKMLTNDACKL